MARTKPDTVAAMVERLARLVSADEYVGGLNPAQWQALRYIDRCNRFSNSPIALTRYLGATKGTISQTVSALERKGLIDKTERAGGRRSLHLDLTDAGRALLEGDPWRRLDAAAGKLKPKTRKRVVAALAELLGKEIDRANLRGFGVCRTCRYFREKSWTGKGEGPHQCLLFEAPLSKREQKLICIEHDPA